MWHNLYEFSTNVKKKGGGHWFKNYDMFMFMKYELLSLILTFTLWYFHYQQTDSDAEQFWSMWRQTHYNVTNNNNNVHL
jgi:hypothetical protein